MMDGQRSLRDRLSAGIQAYRHAHHGPEVLLAHGGPFWREKDDAGWFTPKGEIDQSENPELAARREFGEKLGPAASIGRLQPSGEIRQRGGKRVIAFMAEENSIRSRPGHAGARQMLACPYEDRLFFAGEATHGFDFSTAHGAHDTGVRAADQAIASFALLH